jgi:hypothetical protein
MENKTMIQNKCNISSRPELIVEFVVMTSHNGMTFINDHIVYLPLQLFITVTVSDCYHCPENDLYR